MAFAIVAGYLSDAELCSLALTSHCVRRQVIEGVITSQIPFSIPRELLEHNPARLYRALCSAKGDVVSIVSKYLDIAIINRQTDLETHLLLIVGDFPQEVQLSLIGLATKTALMYGNMEAGERLLGITPCFYTKKKGDILVVSCLTGHPFTTLSKEDIESMAQRGHWCSLDFLAKYDPQLYGRLPLYRTRHKTRFLKKLLSNDSPYYTVISQIGHTLPSKFFSFLSYFKNLFKDGRFWWIAFSVNENSLSPRLKTMLIAIPTESLLKGEWRLPQLSPRSKFVPQRVSILWSRKEIPNLCI